MTMPGLSGLDFFTGPSTLNYQRAWEFLDKLQFFKIKLGLDSMRIFLDRLGRPDRRLRFIHLAGTNGKGSVGAMLHAILSAAGFRVGFYTSPHLSSVRERFRIGDEYISEDDFAFHSGEIIAAMGAERITYFEFTTALALLWFAARDVDIVILETGLGGRLDATNVITPELSLITNVAMDHEAYLGNTITSVATEKAGIIKPGVPVISGVEDPEAAAVVAGSCCQRRAPLFRLGREFTFTVEADGWGFQGRDRHYDHLPLALAGRHQRRNAALALAALDALDGTGIRVCEEDIRRGLAGVRWPGRLEFFSLAGPLCGIRAGDRRQVLVDGAHNPAGAAALAHALANGYRRQRLIVVWAAMADKDMASTLGRITPLAGVIFLTRPESERSACTDALAASIAGFSGEVHCEDDVAAALTAAFVTAGPDDLVLIAGSLYLVGRAREIMLGGLV